MKLSLSLPSKLKILLRAPKGLGLTTISIIGLDTERQFRPVALRKSRQYSYVALDLLNHLLISATLQSFSPTSQNVIAKCAQWRSFEKRGERPRKSLKRT